MLDVKFIPRCLDTIIKEIKEGTAKIMTDGSEKDKRSTSGFLYIGKDDTNLFEGGNHVPGREKDQNSFRAELAGILALVLIINYICKEHEITSGEITLGCDCKSALRYCFSDKRLAPCTTPCYDIIRRICQGMARSPINWKQRHVQGHQDDHKNYDQLDTWGKANCRAHNLAAKFMASHPGYINKSFEADDGWTVKINGDNVVS